jgi:hypothetical protein
MIDCAHIQAEAAGLAALPPGDPERDEALAHARGCDGCARALREAERLQALLGEAEPAPVPPEVLARASRAILSDLRREARRRAASSAGAACVAFVLLTALARQRSPAPGDRALAAALAIAAVALAVAATRWARAAIPAAAAAALAGAAAAGSWGPFDGVLGLDCTAAEIAAAGAVVGAMWLALRGGSTSPARSAVAAAAAAGALAGDAALQLTCAGRGHLPHLLLFHVGGVLAAAALGGLLRRRRVEASPSGGPS